MRASAALLLVYALMASSPVPAAAGVEAGRIRPVDPGAAQALELQAERARVRKLEEELRTYQQQDLDRRLALARDGYKRAPIAWDDLEDKLPPERDWAIRGWLPMGHVTLLAGRGGIGKTLLAQTISSHLCTLQPYIDDVPRARRVLFWAGEDDRDELWRRQAAIAKALQTPLSNFAELLIVESFVDRDMTLAAPVLGGALHPTPLLEELAAQIRDYGAEYVWLDSLARIFGGNENNRHEVTSFVSWLTAAAGTAGVGVIGHPGKAQGSEYSGSTAWEGSVRARLFLGHRLPDQQEDDRDEQSEVLFLSRRKANYAPQDYRRLVFVDGTLKVEAQTDAVRLGGEFVKDAVLRAVRKLGELNMHGNASTRSGDYLPKLAKQYDLLDGVSEKQFGAAMRQLILEQRLKPEAVGQYANRSPRMGLVAS